MHKFLHCIPTLPPSSFKTSRLRNSGLHPSDVQGNQSVMWAPFHQLDRRRARAGGRRAGDSYVERTPDESKGGGSERER